MPAIRLDLSQVPEPLHAGVGRAGDELAALELPATDRIVSRLPRVLACSEYAVECLRRDPGLLARLDAEQRLERSLSPDELRMLFRREIEGADSGEAELLRRLRQLRHQELFRIVWRDLAGEAGVSETLRDLSALADAAICTALGYVEASLAPTYGQPRDERGDPVGFGVLGMGKLGGGELNFSSDVDLVFVYSDIGATDGRRSVANEEYFRLVARRLIDVLARQTSDGFVYRVDARLRPFGGSGPLAVSLPSLEAYLLQHGRDWERYAYVKARLVNSWDDADYLYENVLRPFVYRRYLDYGVFSSLREMKALIEAEVQRQELRDNVKLGPGGIREIEFIAQSLQLVRGGMIPELRERQLRESLRKLAKFDCLPEADASELDAAYCYLRLVENRLQAIRDQQTHDLPSDPLDRTRLACAMGARDWAGLMASLDVHRQAVKRHFRAVVFRGAGESEGQAAPAGPAAAWARPDAPEAEELLRAAGFVDPAAAVEKLRALRASSVYRRMDEPGRQRLDALMPAVIASAAHHTEPQRALDGVLEVIEAIGRRSAYFALLNENPAALERLVGLCGMSTFLVRQLAAHPLLLDELLDTRVSQTPPDRAELSADLEARMAGIPPADVEGRLDALRNFQQAATFRVAVVDLNGALPLMRVSDRLTDVAELVLEAALEIAWRELAARHGQPRCGQRSARFAIVAYGKLGGLELGYGSDLDLVFLHDSEGQEACTDGAQPVENAVFFARLTRRLISILTMPTTSGKLYDVDIRLRPSGRSGLLVSSLAAFDRYQREDAWTWEHQALLRSRGVAGSPEVREAFEALRKRALADYVRRDKLREDVLEMRERMRAELSPDKPGEFEIKQDRGGITDIEFMVQYLVLRDAHAHPELVTYSDNIRQLEALAREAILPGAAAEQLAETYRRYRQRLHRLSLAGLPGVVPDAEFAEERRFVTQQWAQVFG